jgi:lipoyl(octanoyl) transferase
MNKLVVRDLGLIDYSPVHQAMQAFINQRNEQTSDEIWVLNHYPVFTQGQAGKAEHILAAGDIPVVQTERGGQVTYHGPGQLVLYPMLDTKRLKIGVRDLVSLIEDAMVETLRELGIKANADPDAPGVYVSGKKIASLGLRIRKGFSFHGLAINVDMDMQPFSRINPCGYQGLEMTQVIAQNSPQIELNPSQAMKITQDILVRILIKKLGYLQIVQKTQLPSV